MLTRAQRRRVRTRSTAVKAWSFSFPAGLVAALTLGAACSNDFDTSRTVPVRGTLGAELFGVVCDRVGAQSLHEDLTGASFRDICHKRADGTFADKVDESALPPMVDGQPDLNGTPVPLDKQKADRAYAVGRVETLARHPTNLIPALDATFPAIQTPIKPFP